LANGAETASTSLEDDARPVNSVDRAVTGAVK